MPTKNYYESVIQDSGLTPVEAEDLQAKFDAITQAEYDQQRTNLQTATNQYYNQLYNTQQTTMDTIRQANAQAVASGASRGVQAANELSALLGLQSEAVTGATDLANQATTLAQDETQAMLENMLNAETQAAEQNQALAQILTQAGSVDVEQQNANTAAEQVRQQWQQLIEQIRQTNPTLANQLQTEYNAQYADTNNSTDTDTGTNTSGDISTKPSVYEALVEVPQGAQPISAVNAYAQQFGGYQGSDNSDSAQTKYVNAVLQAAKDGKIADGTIIDFNEGSGLLWNRGSVYAYYDGNWYQTNLNRLDARKRYYNNDNINELGISY